METLLNKKNIFTNYRHPINKNTKSYIFAPNNKLDNPFLKQNIFPHSHSHHELLHRRPKSCSNRFISQLKNGENGVGYPGSFKQCKSQSAIKYDRKKYITSQHVHEQFIKSRNKQIQRKCLLVFGPEALRYIPNNQQQNNQYFDKNNINSNINNKQQRHKKANKIFRESTNIYSQNQQQKIRTKTKNNHKKSKKSINQNQQKQSSSNSRFKVKKILSWNVQNQNIENLQPASQTSSQQNITSANQKNFRHPTFGIIDKSTKNTEIKNFKCQKQSSIALKFNQKPNQDYVLQSSDGFKIQGSQSSPPNSLPSVQQQLFKQKSNAQNRNNLQYNSYFDSDGADKSSSNFFRLIDLKKCSRMSYNSEDSKIQARYKLNYDNQNNKSRSRFNFPNQIKYEGVKFELLPCII